jgi:hypothetical protein
MRTREAVWAGGAGGMPGDTVRVLEDRSGSTVAEPGLARLW